MERSTPRLLTLKEVAERLAVSVRTVRRLVDRRKIKAIKVGERSPRVSEEELCRIMRDGVG